MTAQISFTPIRDGYSVVPTYPTREAILEGGKTRKYSDALYLPHEVTVNWKLGNPTDYTNFMGFFRTTLLETTEYFLMDLVTDIGALVPHRCRTKGGMPRLTQVNGNCFYVSATLEVEVNPTYTGLILYSDPGLVTFSHITPRLVGPIQPGDTVQILNSSGTHPGSVPDWTFDGTDDEIQMGDVLDMTRTTPRSIFVWYSSTEYGNALVSKQSAANATGWRFTLSSTAMDVILCGPSGTQQIQVAADPRPPIDGNEYHFGWTYNGNSNASGFTFYLDGAATGKTNLTNNLTSAVITNSEPLQIGRRGTTAPFEGTIRHVSIWNRELTSGEVAQVYGSGSPPDLSDLSFFSDCIGWWKIGPTDSDATGGVIDYSSSGNDGSALNGLAATILTGEVEVNLDGIYEVESVTPNNEIRLVDPELVNSDWALLATLGFYGPESLGDVISTLTRHPRET